MRMLLLLACGRAFARKEKRERETERGLCFSSLFLCVVRSRWLSFFSFVWSQKKIRKKKGKRGKKYTNTTKENEKQQKKDSTRV